jgi:hypothetical protein
MDHAEKDAKHHAAGAPASGGSGFASIVSQETFKKIFPNSNALYTYGGLIAAARKFPLFCNEGFFAAKSTGSSSVPGQHIP